MCLDNVYQFKRKPAKPGKCYKVVKKSFGGYYSIFYSGYFSDARYTQADNYLIRADNGQKYPAGFHVFTNKKNAIKYARHCVLGNSYIIECKYKNVIATGDQLIFKRDGSYELLKCLVVDELKAVREIGEITKTFKINFEGRSIVTSKYRERSKT